MTETGAEIRNGRGMWEKTKVEAGSRTETRKDPEIEDVMWTDMKRETDKDEKTNNEQEPGVGREELKMTFRSQDTAETGRRRAGPPGRRKRIMVRGEPGAGSVPTPAPMRFLMSSGALKNEGTPGSSGTPDRGRIPEGSAVIVIPTERQVPP